MDALIKETDRSSQITLCRVYLSSLSPQITTIMDPALPCPALPFPALDSLV